MHNACCCPRDNTLFILLVLLCFKVMKCIGFVHISNRQRKVLRANNDVPKLLVGFMDKETLDKSRNYSLETIFVKDLEMILKTIFFILNLMMTGLLKNWQLCSKLTRSKYMRTAFFIAILTAVRSVLALPITLYTVYMVQKKYDFKCQDMGTFLKDFAFGIAGEILLEIVTAWWCVTLIKLGHTYFILGTVCSCFFFNLVLAPLIKELINPRSLSNVVSPLPECRLRDEIEELALAMSYPLREIYVDHGWSGTRIELAGFLDGRDVLVSEDVANGLHWDDEPGGWIAIRTQSNSESNESNESNDGDKSQCEFTGREVLAIIAHKFSHFQSMHDVKLLVFRQCMLFLKLFTHSYIMHSKELYKLAGFAQCERPLIISLIVGLYFISEPFDSVVSQGCRLLQRNFEYKCDDAVKARGFGTEMSSVLAKSAVRGLNFPMNDAHFTYFRCEKPTVLQRIWSLQND